MASVAEGEEIFARGDEHGLVMSSGFGCCCCFAGTGVAECVVFVGRRVECGIAVDGDVGGGDFDAVGDVGAVGEGNAGGFCDLVFFLILSMIGKGER